MNKIKKRIILVILLLILIISLFLGYLQYKELYFLKGWSNLKGGINSDLGILRSKLNSNKGLDYIDYFGDFEGMVNISSVLNKELTGKNNNGLKDKFILKNYNNKCFIFEYNILDTKNIHNREFLIDLYGVNDINYGECTDNNCYILFTEKGFINKGDNYICE